MASGAGFDISTKEFLLVAAVAAALIWGAGNIGSGIAGKDSALGSLTNQQTSVLSPITSGIGDVLHNVGGIFSLAAPVVI